MRVSKPPEQRKAELIAAARRLFDERGVDNTRVADIVKQVGVAQGVFYYYFKSKQEMVQSVLQQVTGELRHKTDHLLLDQQMGFCEKLARYIEIYIDLLDQFLADGQANLSSLSDGLPGRQGVSAEAEQLLWQVLDRLVKQGVGAGELTIEYPEQAARVLLFGLLAVAAESLPNRQQLYAIVEQGLGLKKGCLGEPMQNQSGLQSSP